MTDTPKRAPGEHDETPSPAPLAGDARRTSGEEVETLLRPRLVIERGRVVPFEELPDEHIALDGYCQGPALDVERGRFSFDHHDKCVRMATRASCQQVLDALLVGLDPQGMTICINDVDGDTALAVWLLQHPERARAGRVRAIVESVGEIDAHGPAYPALDSDLARLFFEDVMKPEVDLRRARTYGQADLATLLEECLARISAFVDGEVEAEPQPEKHYEVTHEGTGFVLARSTDFIFDKLYADGHTRAVAYDQLPDGSYAYTVGKQSELVMDFPVGPASKEGTILFNLAQVEPGWGGGSTIGGAPRNPDGSRSHLPPERVLAIVEETVQAWKARRTKKG